MKFYNLELIIYDLQTLSRVEDYCNLLKVQYAYILHDKDLKADGTPKDNHIHFLCFFPYQKTISRVSKLFDIEEKYIEKIKNKSAAIRYLIHLDCKPEENKYKYDFEKIVSNFDLEPYFNTELDKSKKEGLNILQLVDYIKDKDYNVTIEDLIRYAVTNNLYSDLRRNQNLILKFIYENR